MLNWLEILFIIYCILFTFIHAMQNGQNVWQLSLWTLPKAGSKVWALFWSQTSSLDWILFHFVWFTNKIFGSAQISHLRFVYTGNLGWRFRWAMRFYNKEVCLKLQSPATSIYCFHACVNTPFTYLSLWSETYKKKGFEHWTVK